MYALVGPAAALGVTDDPAHGIARGHRHQLFARLQGDVGDAARAGVDLVQRAVAVRPDLHRIDEAVLGRLDARRLIRRCDITRSEEHTSELQSLMRISYAVFCVTK